MTEVDNVVSIIRQVELRERPADAKQVHDLHGLHVLNLALTGNRDVVTGQESVPGNNGRHNIAVRQTLFAFPFLDQRE